MIETHGAFILNENNELLICHTTNSKLGKGWSIPKGLSEENETSLETVLREVKEEVNINMKILNYFPLHESVYQNKKKKLKSYLFRIEKPINELKCNSFVDDKFPENDIIKWVSLDEAEKLIHVSQSKLIKDIRRLIGVK